MRKSVIALAFGIVGLMLAITTVPKLIGMAQLRGFLPGARVEQLPVRAKWIQPPRRVQHASGVEDLRTGVCWVTWTDQDVRKMGDHRMDLDVEQCRGLAVGGTVEGVWVVGSGAPLRRGSVWAANGNFAFDLILLLLEVALVGWGLRHLRLLRPGVAS